MRRPLTQHTKKANEAIDGILYEYFNLNLADVPNTDAERTRYAIEIVIALRQAYSAGFHQGKQQERELNNG